MGKEVQRLIETEFRDRIKISSMPKRGESFSPLLECDVVVDFSLPDAMTHLAQLILNQDSKKPMPAIAIGSTGWQGHQNQILEDLSKRTCVLVASNFSIGVAALHAALARVSAALIQRGYAPFMVERHHIHKKDSPSGTALALQRSVSPLGPGNVPVHSIRAGEIIGDHTVSFISAGDELMFSHSAKDRSIFARGALQAAIWLVEQKKKNPRGGQLLSMDMLFG
jgi:4-hydroxy-tetrahydrodipicolinate reductase